MEMLINSDKALRRYVPNSILHVRGETSLFEKITPDLEAAQQWAVSEFVSAELMEELLAMRDDSELYGIVCQIIALDALHRAVPMLDVVFTPNGMATVGNQNLVAASQARTDRLMKGLLSTRDRQIGLFLTKAKAFALWRDSERGRFFRSSLCQSLGFVVLTGKEPSWDSFLECRSVVVDAEQQLAERCLSPRLLAELQEKFFAGPLSPIWKHLYSHVLTQVLSYVRTGAFIERRLTEIVNFLRLHPEDFPSWRGSAVAELYNPPLFRNELKSGGYFF